MEIGNEPDDQLEDEKGGSRLLQVFLIIHLQIELDHSQQRMPMVV